MLKQVGALLLLLAVVSGCGGGGDKYRTRFDALVPPGWTLDTSTGSVEEDCKKTGAACGSIQRRYYLNSDLNTAARAMEQFYPKQQCAAKRDGNGVSVDCTDVHLSISFTTETASITLTKR